MENGKDLKKYFSQLGKKGGQTTASRYGKEHFVKMGKRSKRGKSLTANEK